MAGPKLARPWIRSGRSQARAAINLGEMVVDKRPVAAALILPLLLAACATFGAPL